MLTLALLAANGQPVAVCFVPSTLLKLDVVDRNTVQNLSLTFEYFTYHVQYL